MRTTFLVAFVLLATAFGAQARADEGAFVDCKSKVFRDQAGLDAAFQCTEIARETLSAGNNSVSIRTLHDASTPADLIINYAGLALEATRMSLQTYGQQGFGWEFANVTLILMDPNMADGGVTRFREAFKTTYADANAYSFPTDCIVRIAMRTLDNTKGPDPLEYARLVIAHEIFHCVAGWNYPKQAALPASHWWVEGTAVFFATLAFNGADDMQTQSATFVAAITEKPLTQLPYVSAYFFAWLWGEKRDDVPKLLAAMPTSGGEAEQQAAVNAVLRDRLSEFARDAVDGQIKDVEGNPLPAIPVTKGEAITATRTFAVSEKPFVVVAKKLDFKDGLYGVSADKQHDLYHLDIAADDSKWLSGFFWTEGGCGRTRTYYLVGMRGDAGAQDVNLTAERTSGECVQCMTIPEKDQCLVGQWRLDNTSLVRAISGNLGESVDYLTVSGFGGMNVRADGTHSFAFNDYTIEGQPENSRRSAKFYLRLSGIIDSSWGATNGQMRLCYDDSDATLQMTAAGSVTDPIKFEDMMNAGMPTRQDYTYQCNKRSEVMLTLTVEGQPILLRFERVD